MKVIGSGTTAMMVLGIVIGLIGIAGVTVNAPIYNRLLAVWFRSVWFLTIGVYYLTVCGMRAGALRLDSGERPGKPESRAMRQNAVLMFCLAIIFSGVVCMTIMEQTNKVYPTVIAITMAIYTFYCVVSAIRNIVRRKKIRTIQMTMLRNTSAAYAMGSLFGLECMMLGTFGDLTDRFTLVMEAASGAGFFIIIVLIGVNLLLLAGKKDTKI